MYEFVYRILFRGGEIKIVGDEYLATLCHERADQIIQIKRVEVHTDDWLEVTAVTMRRILEGIEARRAQSERPDAAELRMQTNAQGIRG